MTFGLEMRYPNQLVTTRSDMARPKHERPQNPSAAQRSERLEELDERTFVFVRQRRSEVVASVFDEIRGQILPERSVQGEPFAELPAQEVDRPLVERVKVARIHPGDVVDRSVDRNLD